MKDTTASRIIRGATLNGRLSRRQSLAMCAVIAALDIAYLVFAVITAVSIWR